MPHIESSTPDGIMRDGKYLTLVDAIESHEASVKFLADAAIGLAKRIDDCRTEIEQLQEASVGRQDESQPILRMHVKTIKNTKGYGYETSVEVTGRMEPGDLTALVSDLNRRADVVARNEITMRLVADSQEVDR